MVLIMVALPLLPLSLTHLQLPLLELGQLLLMDSLTPLEEYHHLVQYSAKQALMILVLLLEFLLVFQTLSKRVLKLLKEAM